MKTSFSFWAFLLPIMALSANLSAQHQNPDRIRVEGNSFVNSDREAVVFRGLNTSDPSKLEHEGKWNERYFQEMKNWGANVVRFPIHPQAWRERGPEAYLEILNKGIKWAEKMNMHVILDWHSIGNLKEKKFQESYYETDWNETLSFWRTMASNYKDNPTVAFFELFNEPTDGSGAYGNLKWPEWKSMMEELIFEIRKEGAEAIPLVAGFNWAYDLTPVRQNPIDAPGVAYVSHPYPQKRKQPWKNQWTRDWGFVAEKYPVFLTEIGFCGPDDKGAHVPVIGDESYGDAITDYAAEKGISYVVWVFDPQWSPMLFSDWEFTPTRQGRYFKSALQKSQP